MKRNLLLVLAVLLVTVLISRQNSWAQGPSEATQAAVMTPAATDNATMLGPAPIYIPLIITPSGRALLGQHEIDIQNFLSNAPVTMGSLPLDPLLAQGYSTGPSVSITNTDGRKYQIEINFAVSEQIAHAAFLGLIAYMPEGQPSNIGDEALVSPTIHHAVIAIMRYRNVLVVIDAPSGGEYDASVKATPVPLTFIQTVNILRDLASYLARQ